MTRHSLSRLALLGIVTTVTSTLIGCADQSPSAPPPSPAIARSGMNFRYGDPVVDSEIRRRVDSAARDLALRIGEANGLRNAVSSLRASREDNEHKLSLGQLNAGLGGGAQAATAHRPAVARGVARNFSDLENELEAYMPVKSVRERYDGTRPLIVAWQLVESEDPIGYTAAGERIVLDVDRAPTEPVLVLVPREGSGQGDVIGAACRNSVASEKAIGTWQCDEGARSLMQVTPSGAGEAAPASDECLPMLGETTRATCPGQWVPTPPPLPAGFYMSSAWLSDLHEPWPRGEPEITYLVTTIPVFGRTQDEPIACLSEHPFPTQAFFLRHDEHNETFSLAPTFSGRHTFLTDNQIAQIEGIADIRNVEADLNVIVWEDDVAGPPQARCELNDAELLPKLAGALSRAASLVATVKGFPKCANSLDDPGTFGSIQSSSRWFQKASKVCGILGAPGSIRSVFEKTGGDDDYIGISAKTTDLGGNAGSSHLIVAAGGQVGRFNITGVSQQ